MTPREHYDEAERLLDAYKLRLGEIQQMLLDTAGDLGSFARAESLLDSLGFMAQTAQVHATLATVPRAEYLNDGRIIGSSRG